MIRHGLWDKLPQRPERLFGLHTRPEIPCGQVGVIPGAVMAGKSHFVITLTGVTGHCGSPHKCVDVITAGAAIVNGIQTIVSRNTDPQEPLICAVFSINAGTPENFVPETLTMTGDVRAHSDAVIAQTQNRLKALAEGIAASYQCECEVRFIPEVPVTDNGPEMTALARRAACAALGAEEYRPAPGRYGLGGFRRLWAGCPRLFLLAGHRLPRTAQPLLA